MSRLFRSLRRNSSANTVSPSSASSNQERRNIPFFEWLSSKINKKGTLMTINKSTQSWNTETGKIESVHPPLSPIKYKEINATPVKNVVINPNYY